MRKSNAVIEALIGLVLVIIVFVSIVIPLINQGLSALTRSKEEAVIEIQQALTDAYNQLDGKTIPVSYNLPNSYGIVVFPPKTDSVEVNTSRRIRYSTSKYDYYTLKEKIRIERPNIGECKKDSYCVCTCQMKNLVKELKEAKKVYTTKCFDPYCKNIEIDPTTKIVTSIGNSRYLQTLKDYEINNYVESISTENAFVDLNKVLQSNNPSLSLFINTIVTKKVLSICYFEPDCLEITEKRDLQYYYHRYLSFLEKVEEKSSSVKSLYHGDLSNLEEIDLSYLYGYNELHPYLVLNKTTSRLFGRILLYTFKDEEANQNFKIFERSGLKEHTTYYLNLTKKKINDGATILLNGKDGLKKVNIENANPVFSIGKNKLTLIGGVDLNGKFVKKEKLKIKILDEREGIGKELRDLPAKLYLGMLHGGEYGYFIVFYEE